MRFAVLGPVQVWGEEGPLEIKGTLRRTLLAALLLRPNEVVSSDQLAELLWGDRSAVSATTSLYNQVMRLRQALGPHAARIRAVPPGYVIDVEPGELDTAVFAQHRAAGAEAARDSDWTVSARAYSAALDLWRGEPLADVAALQPASAIEQLREERISALQARIEADLHLARHDQVIGELRTLIDEHPWREALHGQLMLALHRAGRQPEALEVFRDLRRAVAHEFGVEPSDAVRALHTRILRSDPALAAPSPGYRQAEPPRAPAARQLPADTRVFTGRATELEALIAASRRIRKGQTGQDTAPTVVVSAINGMGGIGKTALAIRAAHRLAEHYPDGHLFIDLHGHSADLDPVDPAEALNYLLISLGVKPQTIPHELEERAAFYRTRLAGTSTLIVLDNARSARQIKHLIPAAPGCLVIVTSRSQLLALDDADFVSLDTLPPHEAVALLSHTAGPGRVNPDDPAAGELAQLCGRLPLAIRIIGARLRHRSHLAPETLLAALRAERDLLAPFKDGERDIARVFATSLDVLPEAERRLFTRLGLIPGPDFDAFAAAALQDTGVAHVERLLETLLDHSLLVQHEEGRYRLHDLLRAYARTRAAEGDARDNEAALVRVLHYYAETTASAKQLWPEQTPGSRRVIQGGRVIRSTSEARSWFDREWANLLAAFGQEALDPRRRFDLAADLADYLRLTGLQDQAFALVRSAVHLARALDDVEEEARALRTLGARCRDTGRHQEALAALNRALEIHRGRGDRLGEARILAALGWTLVSSDTARALACMRQAVELFRATQSTEELPPLLTSFAAIANQNGRFEEAVESAEMLLASGRKSGSTVHQAQALFSLSHAFYALGRFAEIEPALTEARTYFQGTQRVSTASTVQELGRLRMMRGQFVEAAQYLEEALAEFAANGFVLGEAHAHAELGRTELRLGRPEAAMIMLETGLRLALNSEQLTAEALIRTNMGYVHIARGEFSAADEQLRLGLDVSRRGGFMFSQVEARVGLCVLAYARDGAALALPHYREVLEFVRAVRHPREEAAALVGLGRCALEVGDRESGIAHLHEAIELYDRMGSALDVAETRAHLRWQ